MKTLEGLVFHLHSDLARLQKLDKDAINNHRMMETKLKLMMFYETNNESSFAADEFAVTCDGQSAKALASFQETLFNEGERVVFSRFGRDMLFLPGLLTSTRGLNKLQ